MYTISAQVKAEEFVEALQRFPVLDRVFNPWRDVDLANDLSPQSPVVRAEQLVRYLSERIDVAEKVLIAEAPGYQGCHFSGIAMTSERILLGHQIHNGVSPNDVFMGAATKTSKHVKNGANEPTATVVWKAIKASGANTRKIVLWNSFAFHPMKSGYLTNRKPTLQELRQALYLLEHFLSLFPKASRIPVGRVAEAKLGSFGIACAPYVRHPANGGATEFRFGMDAHWKVVCSERNP